MQETTVGQIPIAAETIIVLLVLLIQELVFVKGEYQVIVMTEAIEIFGFLSVGLGVAWIQKLMTLNHTVFVDVLCQETKEIKIGAKP